jgi:type IV pilus assembly protein PilQ
MEEFSMSFHYLYCGNSNTKARDGRWTAIRRLAAALVIGVMGCTVGRQEPIVEEQLPKESPSPGAETRPQSPVPVKERDLGEQAFRVQELTVREQNNQTVIRVIFSKPVAQYRHFTLGQPARIVLDVFGEAQRLPKGESFRVDTHWVGNLRLNSGEGYLRLTAEIAAAAVPAYEIETEDSGLRVVIGPADPSVPVRKELDLVRAGKRADIRLAEAKPGADETAALPGVTAEKKYTGQRISLDFKDADIKNVFRLLGDLSGLNIVITGEVQKKVTLRLTEVPWDQALDLLIETNGLGKEQIGNVIRISTAAQLKSERDALADAKKSRENLEELQSVYFSVNYAKVKELEQKIKPILSARGQVVFDERSNTIFVRDIRKAVDDVTTLISKLDARTPQVLIESNLIETTPSFARALGIQLQVDVGKSNATFNPVTGAVTGGTGRIIVDQPAGAPFAGDPFFSLLRGKLGPFRNLAAFLSAAETDGNIRIISRPSVMTLNNVASTIQSLRVLRISLPSSTNIASGTGSAAGTAVATERIPVGIILTVVPQVSADGFILMNISVKSSSIADSPTVGAGGSSPVIPFDELSREAIANVLVRDGETIVIGGIMKDTKASSESGIPYLKEIPVLGWLFKNTRWQKDFEELIVFITPRIISGGSENLPSAEHLWRDQMRKTDGT